MNQGKRILLTGATGFLGSHIMAALLQRGYGLIVLVRSKGGLSVHDRIARLLDWHGVGEADRTGLETMEGRLDEPDLGLTAKTRLELASGIAEIVHCASDTSFSLRKREAVERANIQGLQNILDLAEAEGCGSFHYISTAFVAGKRDGLCGEELRPAESFHNVYEESKFRAERIALEHCRSAGIRLSIYRPSIVYGDSRTGRTLRFNALYYPIKTIFFLKELFETDIRERGGVHAREMGVHAGKNGTLFLPIRVEVERGGGLNLIPVDYFVKAFMHLRDSRPDGGIFHIVNSRSKSIEELIDYINPFFGIAGLCSCPHDQGDRRPRNALETLFDSYLDIYAPYMRDTRIFSDTQTRSLLSREKIECPDFDYENFSRCMNYALETDWGRSSGLS